MGRPLTPELGITKAKDAANYMFWLRSLQPTIAETRENKDLGPSAGAHSVAMRDLRFTYPLRPDAQVLRGVSLEV